MSACPSPLLVADDVLANLRHLDAEESGAYLLLLMIAKQSKHCALADDDAKLARWARVDPRTWRRIKPAVMAFWRLADGRWTHQRPTKEREFVGTPADIARRYGRQAADASSDGLPTPGTAKPADLRALARQHGAGAISLLAAILNDPTAPLRARLTAAQALLDRGFAKPTRQTDLEATPREPIKITRTFWVPGPDGPVQVEPRHEPAAPVP